MSITGCFVRAVFWSGHWGVCLLRALLFAVRCLLAWFCRELLSHLCFTTRVRDTSLLRACVSVLRELTELAKPVEMSHPEVSELALPVEMPRIRCQSTEGA